MFHHPTSGVGKTYPIISIQVPIAWRKAIDTLCEAHGWTKRQWLEAMMARTEAMHHEPCWQKGYAYGQQNGMLTARKRWAVEDPFAVCGEAMTMEYPEEKAVCRDALIQAGFQHASHDTKGR